MKYLIFLILILGIISCQKEDEPDINDDNKSALVAYFPLDGDYTDASENENLLEAFGNPEFLKGYTNEAGTAISLDGIDDYLIGTIAELDTFSISLWLESYRGFVDEWPPRQSYIFDYSNKQIFADIDGASGATQINCGIDSEHVAGVDIEDGSEWFHLYMAVSNEVKIYLNASLLKTEPLPNSMTYLNDIIYFGRASSDSELDLTYFDGAIDEIMIFNRILNQSEIDELAIKPE